MEFWIFRSYLDLKPQLFCKLKEKMSLKRLCVVVILGCFAQHLPAAQTGISLNGVKWAAIQIFCEVHQKQPICEFVRTLKEKEEQFNQAFHLLKDLESKLTESYTSEAIPHIRESCSQDQIPSFMTHACEASLQIAAREEELKIAMNTDSVGRAAVKSAEDQVEEAKKKWGIITQVTMEAACDLEQVSGTFCDSLNAVKAQKEVLYPIEAELNDYRRQMPMQVEQHIQSLCKNTEIRSSNYHTAICSD